MTEPKPRKPLTPAQSRLVSRAYAERFWGLHLRNGDTRPAQELIRRGLAWKQSGHTPKLRLTRTGKDLARHTPKQDTIR